MYKKILAISYPFVMLLTLPIIGIGQPDLPGGTGGAPVGEGGGAAVPFDDNMNLAFLAIGIVFAIFAIRKYINNKTVTNK